MARYVRAQMKKKFIELIKFGIIGGLMTLFSFGLYYVFIEWLSINYIFANIISYTIAVIVSYFLNERFAFKVKNKNNTERIKKLLQFFMMKLVFLGVDSLFLIALVQGIGINKYIGKIITTIVLTALSFFTSKIIIVGKK
ncbi:GtrA family protein [Akkermansia muciniphila]|uniref:GtrA family protein n=1 Tax=Akkermansia muciniphila TaxID=239935 RepID=UPI00122F7D42|nr:GtrA family protein [Akkermansia muciniphila]KAA3387767.1 GtrA family protein [Akkermansia muciniphila]